MRKVLIILDHYDSDMFKVNGRQVTSDFKHSAVGKILVNRVLNHPQTGLDTKGCKLDLQFFYPKVVAPNQAGIVPKPHVAELRKAYDNLTSYIKEHQPDLVVCYGGWFKGEVKKAFKKVDLSQALVALNIDGYQTQYSFNPSLKQQSLLGTYEKDTLMINQRLINRYLKHGIEGLKPQFGKYQLLTDFNEVKHIFNDILPTRQIVAVDFETNTLQTYLKGAKAIMISLSWKEHQGVSIPINHRLAPNLWTPEQFKELIKMIKELIMRDQYKVFHNGMYDIRMLMDVYGLPYATKCVDTMLMYYELYNENQGVQRGLKHLAAKYTDMAGYEDERDQAFADYLAKDYQKWYDTEMQKYEAGDIKKKPLKSHYKPPVNPVDGSSIDFEWLPMEVVYKYASADTDVTMQLYHLFSKRIKRHKKWKDLIFRFYPTMEDTLAYMEHTGFQIDKPKLEKYREHFTKDMDNLVTEMYDTVPEIQQYEQEHLKLLQEREKIKLIKKADRTPEQQKRFTELTKLAGNDANGIPKYKFSPSSSEKIGYVMYKLMGLKLPIERDYLKPKATKLINHPEKLTWKDFKTDRNNALPYIQKTYKEPLADLLLRYSTDKKMLTSTVDGYGKLLDEEGKIHTHFLLHGTVTSRLASSSPNLQNVKKPTSNVNDPNYNYSAKGLFKSRFDGGFIVNLDYKSLEVFIASVLSHDSGMMQALMDGADIHKRNASIAFDIPYDEVDPTHRQLAKAVD